ncbi:hypothetical protein BDR04DRAFT_187424 [Suillus decipiens]|nr:hypothetical protein BDR04DRAFT_187424 [Suillus decipiens]
MDHLEGEIVLGANSATQLRTVSMFCFSFSFAACAVCIADKRMRCSHGLVSRNRAISQASSSNERSSSEVDNMPKIFTILIAIDRKMTQRPYFEKNPSLQSSLKALFKAECNMRSMTVIRSSRRTFRTARIFSSMSRFEGLAIQIKGSTGG